MRNLIVAKEYIKFIWNSVNNKFGFWLAIFTAFAVYLNPYNIIYGIVLYTFIILNRRTNVIEKEFETKLYDADISKALDTIIDEAFNEYIFMNIGFKKDTDYINAEKEREIINAMIDSVSSRISSTMLMKLEAFYNKDMVPNIISEKIYMAVTAYVVESNKPKPDLNKKENSVAVTDVIKYI
jgi:hypothetical protein